jgi:hypothetical protein
VKVLLATSWDTPNHCGIEQHSRMLIEAVQRADPTIDVSPSAVALDPVCSRFSLEHGGFQLVHLNHHAALHSRWTPDAIARVRAMGMKVLATVHDTGVPNADPCKAIVHACDAAVVHEPFDDLPADTTHYWRMGVPEYDGSPGLRGPHFETRPMLGTVGHDLPWKNWHELARITREVGWGLVICTPAITEDRLAELHALTPWLVVHAGLDQKMVLATLHECDATAALYVCHNTGQSGAVLQCIGAKKPVLAFTTCRQFRALFSDDLARSTIRWCTTYEAVTRSLRCLPIQRFDPGITALAEQESWRHLGQKYVRLYRELVA